MVITPLAVALASGILIVIVPLVVTAELLILTSVPDVPADNATDVTVPELPLNTNVFVAAEFIVILTPLKFKLLLFEFAVNWVTPAICMFLNIF